jgi:mannose-6-phosphate isomerase-like protein (cupin superfamily)
MEKRREPSRRGAFLAMAGLAGLPAIAETGKLPNTTMNPDKATVTKEDFGELRVYFDGPTDQLKIMTAGSLMLKPGMQPHPPHQHPEEEMMVIAEGTGEIVVDGQKSRVGPGSMMYCAAGRLHGILNTGKTPLLFYYSKWKA